MSNNITKHNNTDFNEIISIIERARENVFRSVNRELISMYWEIGKYLSRKVQDSSWGKSVITVHLLFKRNILTLKVFLLPMFGA